MTKTYKRATITDDRPLFELLQGNGLELLIITTNDILSIAVNMLAQTETFMKEESFVHLSISKTFADISYQKFRKPSLYIFCDQNLF